MSKKANPVAIGAFVMGALALTVIGLLLFGGGKFLKEKQTFVLYFEEPLGGLDVGAPVDFQGVRVGTVTDVRIVIDHDTGQIRLPVIIDFEPDRAAHWGDKTRTTPEQRAAAYLKRGLRARLGSQSLVTGKLKVELGFFPDTPLKLVKNPYDPYAEIPTIPGPFTQFKAELDKLPLEEIVVDAHRTMAGINRIVNSPAMQSLGTNINELAINMGALTRKLEALPLGETLEDFRTVTRSREFLDAITNLNGTLEASQVLLRKMERESGPLQVELFAAMNEMARASDSLRQLAETIELQPESILRGKSEE
ncbi:MAG TPA: MlaD family protein [Kiritimatiellia bacterium]